jgi:oligopeptide/dipeptide ABC transporter ATP-binding protein
MLDAVKMPEARKRMRMFPHEFSGGMRQRVMIAMALLCRPKLLIADEPTTALDVTVQAQIMTLLNELKREFNTAIIMITHDLGVVAGICDKVLVMYAGRTMEYGKARDVFYNPAHPYSIGLLNAVPRLDAEGESLLTIPGNPPNLLRLPKVARSSLAVHMRWKSVTVLRHWKSLHQAACAPALSRMRSWYERIRRKRNVLLEIADLKVHFDIKDGKQWFWQPPKTLKAVDGVTLRLYEGETWAWWANQAAVNRPCPCDYRSGESHRR